MSDRSRGRGRNCSKKTSKTHQPSAAFYQCGRVIHSVDCLTTGPKTLPKPALHIVRSGASFFKWEYPLRSLRSSSSFLRLLPCLPVTSNPPFIFSSITRCRRQFLRKMWPIQLVLRLRISCRIFFCSLTLSNKWTCIWQKLIAKVTLQWRQRIHHMNETESRFGDFTHS
jgi:hypothetical protein